MSGILASVDQRTQLAGHNRLELLLFRLQNKQLFGINVFKVREVIRCPRLSELPNADAVIRGISNIRGKTITIIDMGMAIGLPPVQDLENSFVIITEYNRTVQGFVVASVDRIVNLNWKEILPPPSGSSNNTYLTAVCHLGDEIVEIVDVEQVISDVSGFAPQVSDDVMSDVASTIDARKLVLVVDDSVVARNQIERIIQQIGVDGVFCKDGQEALETLKDWADNHPEKLQALDMVLSDIEMPKMDGYTLTAEIRKDPRLADLFVMLHSSLSGVFNENMVSKVGADAFLAKMDPDELAQSIMKFINRRHKTN